jgi:hypothetical protein
MSQVSSKASFVNDVLATLKGKKISASARLVALLTANGLTPPEVAELSQLSQRHVWRCLAELREAGTDARVSATDARVTDTRVSKTPSPSSPSSPPKKKGLPHTPSKEKTTPLSSCSTLEPRKKSATRAKASLAGKEGWKPGDEWTGKAYPGCLYECSDPYTAGLLKQEPGATVEQEQNGWRSWLAKVSRDRARAEATFDKLLKTRGWDGLRGNLEDLETQVDAGRVRWPCAVLESMEAR